MKLIEHIWVSIMKNGITDILNYKLNSNLVKVIICKLYIPLEKVIKPRFILKNSRDNND